ncbi:rhomboid family intramembrane serine protease [Rhodococcus antarcticus]|jgi:membrane associated rhomboid family serine protease|uniref:rhomboid family intramembrane serine protease n=1 Tax=Rhodococcus antarcticus TaxID=2987751 RepID=UPI0033900F61
MSTPGWGPPPGPHDQGWAPPRPGSPPPHGPPAGGFSSGPTTCFRHPERSTGLRCARCGRPACPECLREAAVGFQCVVCVSEGQKEVRSAATVAGARVQQSTPVVTYALLGVSVALYLLTAVLARSVMTNSDSDFFGLFSLWPVGVAEGGYGRLVVSAFLHYGLLHLALNMYALYVLGRELEMVLGRWRYGALYAVSLLGGSTSVMLFENPVSATVGASGAVFGLMGGLAVVLLKLRRSLVPVFTVIGINVVISVTVPGISLFGHLGGLVAGAVAGGVLLYAPAGAGRTRIQVAGLVALAVVLLVAVVLRVVQLRTEYGL